MNFESHRAELKMSHRSFVFVECGSAAGSKTRSAARGYSPLNCPTFAFRFLKLYGRRFSKDDHVLFIKLLYELITLPNLEPHMMQSYARLLIQLLKWV